MLNYKLVELFCELHSRDMETFSKKHYTDKYIFVVYID